MNKKALAIYQDQRIAEEFCNFKCEYCGGLCPVKYTTKKDKYGNLTVPSEWHKMLKSMPKEIQKYFIKENTFLSHYNLANDIIDQSKNIVDSDILKISGGELTLYENLCDFVDSIHDKFLSIQILTNGFILNKNDILRYKKMKNVSFQVSLDGVTHETNYSKSHSQFITEKVLENIKCLLLNNIGVEINCVLTKYNTGDFIKYLEYFKDADNFVIVPRPVRGIAREKIDFSQEQVLLFEDQVMENYNKYEKILPPKKYFERLIDMMKSKKRNYKCYIPYFIQSIDGYGNYELCPLGINYKNKKNVINKSVNSVEILLDSEYNTNNNYDRCNYCMVQYELFNLYVDDEITESELRKMPSLNNDTIISHVSNIKEKINESELQKIIEKNYNIKINKIEKNNESTDGNVYIIYSNNDKYVVKIYDNFKHTCSIIKLHEDLINNNLLIPMIIMNVNDESYTILNEKKYIVMFTFLDGIQLGEKYKNIPKSVARQIANELRKIHDITNGKNYEFNRLPFKMDKSLKRNSILHFDLTRNNIFCIIKNSENIGFIDFDDAKYGPAICDVAIAVANLFFSKTRGVDIEGMKEFLEAYYVNDEKLKQLELGYLKYWAISWIDYIMDGNEFDTSTIESFEVRKDLIEKYFNSSEI